MTMEKIESDPTYFSSLIKRWPCLNLNQTSVAGLQNLLINDHLSPYADSTLFFKGTVGYVICSLCRYM